MLECAAQIPLTKGFVALAVENCVGRKPPAISPSGIASLQSFYHPQACPLLGQQPTSNS